MTRSWVKTLTFTLAFTALLFSAFLAVADVAVPPLKSRVTDLTGTLSANEAVQLEQKLAAFEARKGSQIAVLIVPTTQPETIEQYSIRVAEAWKLGRKGIDDGALLVIAKQDRTLRIEVGYGLEGVLPDAIAKRIIEETIVPKLRQGSFAGAIDAGIEKIMSVIQGEPVPPPARRAERGGASNDAGGVLDNLFFIFIILIVAGRILQSLFGRFVGASLMSASAGFLGWLLFSSIAAGIIIAILAFFLGLFGNSGGGFYRGGPGGWYGGGGFGGRGGGGFGGGGGFSGGGGGFGGGGASGRW
ncbi:MAG: YgcG family protein [Betaproteobacteria bacterium]|nr:YgcG family protein [Betaproteobacteria bacterium]